METEYFNTFFTRFPTMERQRQVLCQILELLEQRFRMGSKLLICGNGGSAADSDHLAGELLKGFVKKRPLPQEVRAALERVDPDHGAELAASLQGGLPVINLCTHTALHTAFANDCDYHNVFAQLTMAYGKRGDVLLAISTSGNSANVLRAVTVASALGLHTIGLSGRDGGMLLRQTDHCVVVPETDTYRIQEVHLPVYHMLCLELETRLF